MVVATRSEAQPVMLGMHRSPYRALVSVLLASIVLAGACSGDSDTRSGDDRSDRSEASSDTTAVPGTPQAVITNGVGTPSLTNDVDLAVTLAYTVRRFGDTEDLGWAADFVARVTETLRVPDDAGEGDLSPDDDLDALAPFLRLLSEDAPVPEALGGEFVGGTGVDTDVMLARSMWCDRVPVSEDFITDVGSAGRLGGYELTHALAATQFMVENGCGDARRLGALSDELAGLTAELLDASEIADLALEACALLAWTGHRELLDSGLAGRVADSVLDDGGWPEQPGGSTSDSHATAWGVRCQLELLHGADLEPTTWVLPEPGGG